MSTAQTRQADGGDLEAAERKRRKSMSAQNCAECRRTKARCNRTWPCSECVRKGLDGLCPDQVSSTALPKTQTIALLNERIRGLEAKLKRLGQDTETEPSIGASEDPAMTREAGRPSAMSDPIMNTSPHDMTAMLSRLALGPTTARRHAGTEASPFYLPMDSEDEDGDSVSRNARVGQVPWHHGGDVRFGRTSDMPGSLLDKCRHILPKRKQVMAIWERFWQNTSWRIQPMLPAYFNGTLLPSIYGPAGPSPPQLAVLFAMIAISTLLDPSILPPSTDSREYHETAWACLIAGKVFTETSTDSLIALSFIGTFLLNTDDKRSPDANFAVFGLALRLAIIAGYHRDPALLYPDITLDEMDQRRRIFHELLASDRLHCMPALLPTSIQATHYDTKLPSDADPKGYFVWKWSVGVQISRVVDYWTATKIPPYPVLLDIDAGIRRMLRALPPDLRSEYMPADAFSLDSTSMAGTHVWDPHTNQPDQQNSGMMVRQRIRLAMHFCMLFFYLHRPCFMRSLAAGDGAMAMSVQTVIEVCRHVINLTTVVMSLDVTTSRWFSFAADLFSVLHCQTVLIVKTTTPFEAQSHLTLLESGVQTLEWNASLQNNSKNRALVTAAHKLLANARQSQQGQPQPAFSFSPLWQDYINSAHLEEQLGDETSMNQAGIGYIGGEAVVSGSQGAGGDTLDAFFADLLDPQSSQAYREVSNQYGQYQ